MIDIDHLRTWIGRSEAEDDVATAAPLRLLSATLDRADSARPGDIVPPLGHWLYFLPSAPTSQLGADGHPKLGSFMPPIPLRRRMYAGTTLEFRAPIRIGAAIRRVSTIRDVTFKQGRSGPLVFVALRHEISGPSGLAIIEDQDLVYRDEPTATVESAPRPAPTGATWQRGFRTDPVLLFRFSALTFNGHRTHYDRPYATGVDGFPDLVVHGPLLAVLLIDLCRDNHPDDVVSQFRFRAVRPIFVDRPFTVSGAAKPDGAVQLWAADGENAFAMDAEARLGPARTA